MNDTKIYEIKSDEETLKNISKAIFEALIFLKNKNLLITNRSVNSFFINTFADSMYAYQKGIVLIERLFKKDKCKQKGEKYKTISEEEKNLIREFTDFSNKIPELNTLSELEKSVYSNKINEYDEKINNISPKLQTLDTFKFCELSLAELDLIDDETLKNISDIYSSFSISFLSALTWTMPTDINYGIKTMEYDDYIDLILIPIKIEMSE